MAIKSILSDNQTKLLKALSKEVSINSNFYLSGGTALAEFYLHHRLSEDLDFFCKDEFEIEGVLIIFKKLSQLLAIKKIDFQQSFNRNLVFVHFDEDIIKTEFTYYPFLQIENGNKYGDLKIDSLIDIATNKLFTIYQKPNARHFIDLFLIIKETNWSIEELIKKAKLKFDWHVDPIQLGTQFVQVQLMQDYPRMLINLDNNIWQNFFLQEAKKLSNKILK